MTAVEAAPRATVVGTRMLRKEDPALLTGEGRFVDALGPFGITDIDMPASPQRVWEAINRSRGNA